MTVAMSGVVAGFGQVKEKVDNSITKDISILILEHISLLRGRGLVLR